MILFELLLRLFPRTFRQAFGDEMRSSSSTSAARPSVAGLRRA